MKLVVAPDRRAVGVLAADWIEASARPDRYLALAVGASNVEVYEELSRRPGALAGARVVSVDELHPLAADDPRAFGSRLRAMLGQKTGATFDSFACDAPDPTTEASAVEARVYALGLAATVLGLGWNGHLALNEPGDRLTAPSRFVPLEHETIRHVGGPGVVGPAVGCLTLGLRVMLSAPRLLLIVLGDNKRDAFASLVVGALTDANPAGVIRLHPDATVLCTRAEASALPAWALDLAAVSATTPPVGASVEV